MQNGPGHLGMVQGSFDLRLELHAKNVFWAPQRGFGDAIPYTKTYKNTKNELLSVNDSGAHFFCAQYRTEFEGGDDGNGYGDYIFLVKQAHPSHIGYVYVLLYKYY
jgi:hypothetical protein